MSNSAIPICPVGEVNCLVLDEVVELREEIKELQQLVHTDSLTDLYNHRHFMAVLQQEMERTRRTEYATALIMVDLDFFKQVNDKWGHEVGNQALISTAKILQSITRQLDTSCRYGGEEFAVILPSCDLITAVQVAERLCSAVALTPVRVDGVDIKLTASLGVALFQAGQSDTVEQFIARADDCLYQAKNNGRNQVVHEKQNLNTGFSVSADEKEALSGVFKDTFKASDE